MVAAWGHLAATVPSLFLCGKEEGVGHKAEWATRLSGLTGYWADWAGSQKNPFGIKIGILNLPRLWKFVQGDLGGILTQWFFLNSSRIIKDFRKIWHVVSWMEP
jgi:hypothetical protein